MSSCYGPRFDDAMALVVHAFRPVRRKGTTIPYLAHLCAVYALVAEAGGDEDQQIAALLHDTLEDIPDVDREQLAARFGSRVARLVEALSDSVDTPKPAWRPRKEAYLSHLRHEPAEVKLISAADKLHNARAIVTDLRRDGPSTLLRFSGQAEGTLWYYEAVLEALGAGWDHPLLAELSASVADMRRLANAA
jgi:(p)ppGpp synthase/HD superfamily hydrolase